MAKKKESLSELKERAKDFVINTFTTYSNRAELEDKWEKWDRMYNSIPSKTTYDGVANLFPPATRRAVKASINFCDEALWGQSPSFKLEGIGGREDQKRAEINTKILQIQQEKINFRQKMRLFLEKDCVFGFCIAKVPYVLKEKYVIKDLKNRKNLMQSIIDKLFDVPTEKTRVPIYDNIDFIPLSPFNIYWDYFRNWEDQEAIIEKISNVSESTLRLMQKASPESYFDIGAILDEMGEHNETMEDNPPKSEKMAHTSTITGLTGDFNVKKKRHELLECWCNFDIDNDGIDEECVIVILDRKHVIRLELNPYDVQLKPYVFHKWEDIEEADSLGLGIVQLAEKSQEALNDFTNQLMDDITLSLDCMWLVDDMAGISNGQLKSRPKGIIRSSAGVDAVKPLRPPDVTAAGMKGIAMSKDDIYQVTGATVSMQGMPARYDTTATEASQMNNASQRDIFSKLRSLEDTVIKGFLRRAYSYNLQFMSTNDVKMIVGSDSFAAFLRDKGKSVGDKNYDISEVLMADYDFIPLGITQIENKIIKGQQLMNLYNIALSSPAGIWNIKELAKQIVKYVADGNTDVLEKDVDQILLDPNDENILMEQGEKPNAKLMENHEMHILVHQSAALPAEFEPIRQEHIQQHLQFMQAQAAQKMQAMQARALQLQEATVQRGLPPQEQPVFAPKGITEEQAGEVPGYVQPPVSLGGETANMGG